MKMGFITDEATQDFETAAKLAKQYGLPGIEIRSVYNKGPHELDGDDIARIAALQKEYGLEIPCISSPFFKCAIGDDREAQHNILRRCIKLAQSVGAKLIRGFTFWDNDDFDERLPEIVRAFDEPIKMLQEAGIVMVLEPDSSVYANTALRIKRVLDGINSPVIQALWEPGNLAFNVPRIDTEADFRLLAPYTRHIHIKDVVERNGKLESGKIGDGIVGYARHFKAIAESGYTGYAMLETHYRHEAEISHALMKLPGGEAFSYMGYPATEESIQAMLALVDGAK